MAVERVFLGCDVTPLQTMTEWILDRLGPDLGDVTLVTSGRRGGRSVLSLLTQLDPRQRPFVPPMMATPGELSELLSPASGRRADRVQRLLSWAAVLENDDLASGAPVANFDSRLLAAAEMCRLQDELGAAGLRIGDANRVVELELPEREVALWQDLARLESAYDRRLQDLSLRDPHEARLASAGRGEVAEGRGPATTKGYHRPGP